MVDVSILPAVNASLNAISGMLLLTGYALIKRRQIQAHRNCMLLAFGSSTLFLISYVVYHANAGSRPFAGQGPVRVLYFAVLISHVILAAAILPLAITTLSRGLRGQYARHVRIARWTFPIWMYVSVTGVVIVPSSLKATSPMRWWRTSSRSANVRAAPCAAARFTPAMDADVSMARTTSYPTWGRPGQSADRVRVMDTG